MLLNSNKRLFGIVALFLAVVAGSYWFYFTSLPANKANNRDVLSEIKYWGELTVGTYANNKPMEFLEKGAPKGFDVDLAEHIGKRLGVAVNIEDYSAKGSKDELLAALTRKEIDIIISSVPPDYKIPENIVQSDAYEAQKELPYVILVRKEDHTLLEAINLTLASLRQEGVMDDLKDRWFAGTQ